MGASELRKKIIEQIESIQSEEILREIYQLLRTESDIEQSYKLTMQEREGILAGLKDIEQGRTFTSEQAKEEVRKWLEK